MESDLTDETVSGLRIFQLEV